MKGRTDAPARVWWLAAAAAVVGSVILMALFSLRPSGTETVASDGLSVPRAVAVGLTRLEQAAEESLVAEEARFYDPTPLFLPTEWNADQKGLPDSIMRNPNRLFADYPAKLQFARDALALPFSTSRNLPGAPAETLSQLRDQSLYLGFGHKDVKYESLSGRGGFLRVVAVDTGRVVLSQALSGAETPGDWWRPVEAMAVIDAAGLVGHLSMLQSSGEERVDNYLRQYLAETFRIGQQLPPGLYRVYVGP